MRRLLTVAETFLVTRRGLVVVPAPTIDEVRGPGEVEVELRLPDGTRRVDTLSLHHEFFTPPPSVHRWCCVFKSLDKAQVPIGTEVWCSEQIFLPADSGNAG
jgi:hypothetical protein